jgi:hypothetical protein
MTDADSRPGSPGRVYLGDNYAQPTVSFEAIPGGNDLSRTESYLGNRNCGAPWTSDEERQAENIAETTGKKDTRSYEKLILARAYAIRDTLKEVFTPGSTVV